MPRSLWKSLMVYHSAICATSKIRRQLGSPFTLPRVGDLCLYSFPLDWTFSNGSVDDEAAGFLTTAPVVIEELRKTFSQEIKECINNCMKSHKDCLRDATQTLPNRVIDVGKGGSHTLPSLHQTRINESAPYVALSYCWGGAHGPITTNATLKSYIQELPLGELSKSITDAIAITHRLGIHNSRRRGRQDLWDQRNGFHISKCHFDDCCGK